LTPKYEYLQVFFQSSSLPTFSNVIIIIIIISFMQDIYTHIPETNYVPREYGVAAILLFLFVVLISLVSELNLFFFYVSTLRSMCAAPNILLLLSLFTPPQKFCYYIQVLLL